MIGAFVVFVLLLAFGVVVGLRRQWPTAMAPEPVARSSRRPSRDSSAAASLHEASLLVGELAALLRAGRSPEQMWRQAARCVRTGVDEGTARVLAAGARAAALGAPVAQAIRDAGRPASEEGTRARASALRLGPRGAMGDFRPTGTDVIWNDVAACVEVAEASGCPLAGVFDRLSVQLESDADAAAARATALAGPQATTRILTVLPFVGLGLGTLVGANPWGVLTTTVLGFACLTGGAVLALVGRIWSARLVVRAGELR